MNPVLGISIFSTITKEKYAQQLKACYETWIKNATDLDLPVMVFVGSESNSKSPDFPDLISLPGVKEDYNSGFDKQFMGLKYMMDNHPCQYYLCTGTDNYYFIQSILDLLKSIQINDCLIGGEKDQRIVAGENIDFLSGGAGLIISHEALSKIKIDFNNSQKEWLDVLRPTETYLKPACDVALCYFAHKNGTSLLDYKGFYGCNGNNKICCTVNPNIPIYSLHYLDSPDIHYYHRSNLPLKTFYDNARNTWSDIYEHIPTLFEFARHSNTIVECGVRSVVSSWAFAYGLLLNDNLDTKKLISCDLDYNKEIAILSEVCRKHDIEFEFIKDNSIKIQIPETDLLFIDTWHIYGHLKRELEALHNRVKKGGYIILHDTEIDGIHGESIRNGWDIRQQSIDSGYPEDEIRKGLKFAVNEFVEKYDNFVIEKVYTNNNGLTIIKRVN